MANARTKAMKSQQKQNKQANLAKRKRKQVEKKRGGKSPRKFVKKPPVPPESVTSAADTQINSGKNGINDEIISPKS